MRGEAEAPSPGGSSHRSPKQKRRAVPVGYNVKTMKPAYLEVNSLIERLHRSFLELVKLELERLGIHDINNVQGMMLFSIDDA